MRLRSTILSSAGQMMLEMQPEASMRVGIRLTQEFIAKEQPNDALNDALYSVVG